MVLSVVFTMALGVSLTLPAGVLTYYGVALAALACAAVPYLLHTHPQYSFSPVRLILPATIALAAPTVSHLLGDGPFRLFGVFGPGALLYAVVLAEYQVVRPSEAVPAQAARLLLMLAAYGIAMAFFLLVYSVKERSLISGTLVAVISMLLAARLLTVERRWDRQVAFYAAAVGLAMAEVLWPLNYWVLGIAAGGLALLVAFYVIVGVIRQLLARAFSQAILMEYATVTAAGAVVVFAASRL